MCGVKSYGSVPVPEEPEYIVKYATSSEQESQNQREERPREELLREYRNLGDGTLCTQPQYRIYRAGWPALYTTDHLYLSFKSSPAQREERPREEMLREY
jgi:hypothetical protein